MLHQSFRRTMPAVLAAIMSLSESYIKFPYNNDQQTGIKRDFYAIARFPNVSGAVDWYTHVRMKPPSINDYAYINRKSYHSVKVPIICDARMSNPEHGSPIAWGHARFFYFPK